MNDIVANCRGALDVAATPDATADQVLLALEAVRVLGELHRDLKAQVEAAAISHIERHGEISDGVRRYYVAPNKSTRCTDVRGTLAAILDAAGGDLDAVQDCLASDAWKPGATRKLLGAASDGYFETKVTTSLKTGEPSPPRLQVVDSRFLE